MNNLESKQSLLMKFVQFTSYYKTSIYIKNSTKNELRIKTNLYWGIKFFKQADVLCITMY